MREECTVRIVLQFSFVAYVGCPRRVELVLPWAPDEIQIQYEIAGNVSRYRAGIHHTPEYTERNYATNDVLIMNERIQYAL